MKDFNKIHDRLVKLEKERESLPKGKDGNDRRYSIYMEVLAALSDFKDAEKEYPNGQYVYAPGYTKCLHEVLDAEDYYAPKY